MQRRTYDSTAVIGPFGVRTIDGPLSVYGEVGGVHVDEKVLTLRDAARLITTLSASAVWTAGLRALGRLGIEPMAAESDR